MNTYNTSDEIVEAIESITGARLQCRGDCGAPFCDGHHPENCSNPAVVLWRDGGQESRIQAFLDANYPDWTESKLWWGIECFERSDN